MNTPTTFTTTFTTATIIVLFTCDLVNEDRWTNDLATDERWTNGEPFVNFSMIHVIKDMEKWLNDNASALTSVGIVLNDNEEEGESGTLVLRCVENEWECLLVQPTGTDRLIHGSWEDCRSRFCNVALQPGPQWLFL